MGQSKSKGLDSNGLDIEGGGKRVTSRRKWRKRKGYSLSASLEADLNTRTSHDPGASRVSVGGGRGPRDGSGPVLVSYNVTRTEDNDLCASHQNLLQPQQRRNSLGVEAGGYLPVAGVTSDSVIAEESDTLDNDENGYHEEKPAEGDWAVTIDADGSQADINNTSQSSERLRNAATPWIKQSLDHNNPLKDHHPSSSLDMGLSAPKCSSGVSQSGEYIQIFSFPSFTLIAKLAGLFMQKYSLFKLENAQTDFCSR